MKKKTAWYVVGVLVLGLALLAVSCGGAPAQEQPPVQQEQPTQEQPATKETEVSGPPAIPHPLAGREDCLQCHGESGFKPFPADHAGRTNDTCTACHETTG